MPSSPLAAALAAALAVAPAEAVPTDTSAPAPAPVPTASAPEPVPTASAPEPVPTASAPEPVPTASSPAEGPARPPAADLGCHGSASCQRLVALGAVAGGLGLAGLAAGTVLLVRPIDVDPGDPTSLISYRPAGVAVLAVGTGLVATWVLTLLAARRAAKLAQRRRAARLPAPRLARAPAQAVP